MPAMLNARRFTGWVLSLSLLAGAAACSDDSAPAAPSPQSTAPVLSTALRSGCFGWPATEFSPDNCATVRTLLQPGGPAVEFTLRDADGRSYSLSGLLATRPVLIMTGSYT
jgi:hypothetical protein